MNLDMILDKFENVRACGNKFSARCPGPGHTYGDRNNSLTIYVNEFPGYGRKVRFYCLQDDHEVIRDTVGLTEKDLWIDLDENAKEPYVSSKFSSKKNSKKGPAEEWEKYQNPDKKPSPKADYAYKDAAGRVMAYKHRTENKFFYWTPEVPVIYNMDKLANHPKEKPVYLVENEMAADSLGEKYLGICLPDNKYDSIVNVKSNDEFWQLITGRKLKLVHPTGKKKTPWMDRDFLELLKLYCKVDEVQRTIPLGPDKDASYEYRASDGTLMATKVIDKNGKASWTPEIPVVYNLERLVSAPKDIPLYMVEGEKDADRLTSLGRLAVCLPHGASPQVEKLKESKDFWNACEGRMIVVCGDYDKPGAKYSRALGKLFSGHARGTICLRWVELAPETCHSEYVVKDGKKVRVHYGSGYDVSDYIDAHGMEGIVKYLHERLARA